MNKQETLEALQSAKRYHLDQMEKIEDLLSHKNITNPTPLAKTECEFGKILYGNRDDFYSIVGAQFYEKLDFYHEQWHKEYLKIYKLFFEHKEQGMFSKLLGKSSVDPLAYDKAKLYYVELQSVTNELLRFLDASLRRVEALSDAKFKS